MPVWKREEIQEVLFALTGPRHRDWGKDRQWISANSNRLSSRMRHRRYSVSLSRRCGIRQKGDCAAAHKLSQSVRSEDGAWVNAYLHRVEGDIANADYWYKRAGKPRSTLSLENDWSEIAGALLSRR